MGLLKRMGLLAGIGTTLYLLVRRGGCCRKRATGDDNGAAPVHSSGVVRDAGPDEQRDPGGSLAGKESSLCKRPARQLLKRHPLTRNRVAMDSAGRLLL